MTIYLLGRCLRCWRLKRLAICTSTCSWPISLRAYFGCICPGSAHNINGNDVAPKYIFNLMIIAIKRRMWGVIFVLGVQGLMMRPCIRSSRWRIWVITRHFGLLQDSRIPHVAPGRIHARDYLVDPLYGVSLEASMFHEGMDRAAESFLPNHETASLGKFLQRLILCLDFPPIADLGQWLLFKHFDINYSQCSMTKPSGEQVVRSNWFV